MAVCSFSAVLALDSISVKHSDSGFSLLVIPIAITSAALVSWSVCARPANLVGWLLLANGLSLASLSLAWPYAYYGGVSHPGGLPGAGWAALWSQTGWPGLYVFLMAIAFVFPDGRLPSPRWRKVIVATVISYIGLELGFALHPGHFDAPLEHISKPTPSYPSSLEWVWIPFYIGVLASLFAAFFAVRSRLRSARGAERLQVLWFTYAAMLIPMALVINILVGVVAGVGRRGDRHRHLRDADRHPRGGRHRDPSLPPLRHRAGDQPDPGLRGPDRLHRRRVTVAIVSGLNALISQSGVAGVLGPGLVAAGVQPARIRLQRWADRRVYGDRSDPYAALTTARRATAGGSRARTRSCRRWSIRLPRRFASATSRSSSIATPSVETAAAHGERGSGERGGCP